jgi:hypothetical protein
MKIYLKFIKQWSMSCKPGLTVAFDEAKGRRVIEGGFAREVPNPKLNAAKKKAEAKAIVKAKAKAEADAKAKAKAETAMATPAGETADVRPNIKDKSKQGKRK